jgi:hypothetical protein
MVKNKKIQIKRPVGIKIGRRFYSSSDILVTGSILSLVLLIIIVVVNYKKKGGNGSDLSSDLEKESDLDSNVSNGSDLVDVINLYDKLILNTPDKTINNFKSFFKGLKEAYLNVLELMTKVFDFVVENIPDLAYFIVEKIVMLDYSVLLLNFSVIVQFIGKKSIKTCFETIVNEISTNTLVVKIVNAIFYMSSINFIVN